MTLPGRLARVRDSPVAASAATGRLRGKAGRAIVSLFENLQKLVAYARVRLIGPKIRRSQYKRTWNLLSSSSDAARLAIAGRMTDAEWQASGGNSVDYIRQAVGLGPEDVVLEIGCGTGRIGAAMAPQCRRWIGCDVSSNMVRLGRRALAGHANVEFVEISGYDLAPIPDRSVDLVYCVVVFMHLDEWDRHAYVLESARVLKPGGRLLVNNINLCAPDGWKLFEAHRQISPGKRMPHISKTSTPAELQTFLARAGFTDIRVDESHPVFVTVSGRKPG